MSAWADGSASTANTASGVVSIVVDAAMRSVAIPVRPLVGPELIAERNGSLALASQSAREAVLPRDSAGGERCSTSFYVTPGARVRGSFLLLVGGVPEPPSAHW